MEVKSNYGLISEQGFLYLYKIFHLCEGKSHTFSKKRVAEKDKYQVSARRTQHGIPNWRPIGYCVIHPKFSKMHLKASCVRAPASLPTCLRVHAMQMALFKRPLSIAPRAAPQEDNSSELSAEEMIQQLLSNDPEAQQQVERVSDAARRVAELQMEQARLAQALSEAQGSDAASAQLRERRANESAKTMIAEAEAKAAELLLKAAELESQSATAIRESAAAEAEKETERLETAKAGAAAAVGGAASSLPLIISSFSTSTTALGALFSLGGAGASAFLFGLVYRYALRQDLNNTQLKGGVVAAFGLVRGIGQASQIILAALNNSASVESGGDIIDTLGLAAAAMGESMLLFAFASVALEFAFQRDWVKPFKN